MANLENIRGICEKYEIKYAEREPMARHTTFKIGGPCEILVEINSAEGLKALVSALKAENIPFFIFGRGSNVLVRDLGLSGAAIIISGGFSAITADGENLICEAGAPLSRICERAQAEGLTGLEFAYGIPGTAGGAVYMNAGAYGGQMSDVVLSCEYLDENCEIREIQKDALLFSYRRSFFTGGANIITRVKLGLKKGDKNAIRAKMNELMSRRVEKQPLEFPSAGSTFKRPEGHFAGALIEQCGLKGMRFGGAEVSEKHAGFVINKGGATAEDVLSLIEAVKEKVKAETGVELEREVEVLP